MGIFESNLVLEFVLCSRPFLLSSHQHAVKRHASSVWFPLLCLAFIDLCRLQHQDRARIRPVKSRPVRPADRGGPGLELLHGWAMRSYSIFTVETEIKWI